MNVKPPRFLLGFALLFWGYQSHLLLLAINMALIIEFVNFWPKRWQFTDKDFNRIADLTTIAIILTFAYFFLQHHARGLPMVVTWMPILLYPITAMQNYSSQGSIRLTSLFWSMRRFEKESDLAKNRINISYIFLFICLLSASMQESKYFFTIIVIIMLWALWPIRSKRYPFFTWLVVITTAITLGFYTYHGLYKLQDKIEEAALDWLAPFFSHFDPFKRATAIGDIGALKQSEKILYRIESKEDLIEKDLLLRRASYNRYHQGTWYSSDITFTGQEPIRYGDFARWFFSKKKAEYKITITSFLQHGKAILTLPINIYQIEDMPILNLETNDLGAVKVSKGPNLMEYNVYIGHENTLDSLPQKQDLALPFEEKTILEKWVKNLELSSESPQQTIKNITAFFYKEFQYSLKFPKQVDKNLTSIANFLEYSRYGHCEYFATTTVLLLRAAGIPARYTSGFAVQEYSELEKAYIIRQRHAHAWAQVYIDGQWQNLDTTPPTWVEFEEQRAPFWQKLTDWTNWLGLKFSQWRWRSEEEKANDNNNWLGFLLIPLFILLIWRLYGKKLVQVTQKTRPKIFIGQDSPFYTITKKLEQEYPRYPYETLRQWLLRIKPSNILLLQEIIGLHEKYRFDPKGIGEKEKEGLKEKVNQWLKK